MAMAFKLLFIVLIAVVAPAVHGVQHTVGGSDGWSQSADLGTWASGETFTVGDTLLFTYTTMHTVDIVSKSDYDNCNSAKALKTFNDGQTVVPLLKSGPMYFICPTMGHCTSGMKLAINVTAPSSTTTPSATAPTTPSIVSPPSDPTPDSDGSGDSTPSTTTPSTSTTTAKSSPKTDNSGVEGYFGHFSKGVVGFSLVVAGLVALMG